METLMAKVRTSDGRIGWGEAFGHKSNPATWAALEEIVAPFYLGSGITPRETQARAVRAFHAFGRTGPVLYAISALDTALWDLAAQMADLPLRHFIDPAARDAVRAYASLVHYGDDPAEVRRHVARARAAGYDAFKLHETSAPSVVAARQAAGPGAQLMVDVNCRWAEPAAAAAIDSFLPLGLRWLEEPLWPPENDAGMARLAARGIPLAAGENASGPLALLASLEAGSITVAQPSVGKIGGITALLEILDATGTADVVPHCFYYGPALLATAQLVATMDDAVQVEVPFVTWPHRLHPLHGIGPWLDLPDAAGLGFAPDPGVLESHLVRRATVGPAAG